MWVPNLRKKMKLLFVRINKTERPKDRKTERQKDRKTKGHKDKKTERLMYRKANEQRHKRT